MHILIRNLNWFIRANGFVYLKVKMTYKQTENWFQEGQACFSTLAEQPSPDVLCNHPVQSLLQWLSTGLAGRDIGIIIPLASGAQSHSDMTAGLISQVSQ